MSKKFKNQYCVYCLGYFEELTEDEFRERYTSSIPYMIAGMLQKKDQPAFTWETHLHFNYS